MTYHGAAGAAEVPEAVQRELEELRATTRRLDQQKLQRLTELSGMEIERWQAAAEEREAEVEAERQERKREGQEHARREKWYAQRIDHLTAQNNELREQLAAAGAQALEPRADEGGQRAAEQAGSQETATPAAAVNPFATPGPSLTAQRSTRWLRQLALVLQQLDSGGDVPAADLQLYDESSEDDRHVARLWLSGMGEGSSTDYPPEGPIDSTAPLSERGEEMLGESDVRDYLGNMVEVVFPATCLVQHLRIERGLPRLNLPPHIRLDFTLPNHPGAMHQAWQEEDPALMQALDELPPLADDVVVTSEDSRAAQQGTRRMQLYVHMMEQVTDTAAVVELMNSLKVLFTPPGEPWRRADDDKDSSDVERCEREHQRQPL
ncbi:hypothetical protein ABPG75_009494 [Micractinium tetrahymenae]